MSDDQDPPELADLPEADVTAALAAVTDQLRAQAPPRMPADVRARVDAALAAAADDEPGAAPAPLVGTVVPISSGGHRAARGGVRSRLPLIAAAAAAVVLVGGGLTYAFSGSGGGGSTVASSAVQAQAGNLPPVTDAGRSFPDVATLAAALQASAGTTPYAATGTEVSAVPQAASGDAAATAGPADLLGCLRKLSNMDVPQVLAVEQITFAGQPALLVTLPGGTGSVDVFVVRTTCSATNEQVVTYVDVRTASPSPAR